MSYILDKDKIIKQKEIEDAFASVAKSIQLPIEKVKEFTLEAKKLSEILGGTDKLKDIINTNTQITNNTQKLAAEQKKIYKENAE
jgi:hypothetical protein